jgi:hypothetical protein
MPWLASRHPEAHDEFLKKSPIPHQWTQTSFTFGLTSCVIGDKLKLGPYYFFKGKG